eukprot:CCRYP_002915-RA/>CCRYP_002915-RA protein AED:0.70 eAED:0.60 QI:0/0/0/1/1/1/2/0/202
MNLALEKLEQKELDEWKKELEKRKVKREQMHREVDLIFDPNKSLPKPQVKRHGSVIESTDGNCIMAISNIEDFIRLSTAHSAKCRHQLVMVKRDNTQGATCCAETLTLSNCNKVKTSQVALGAKYSRKQPELNLRILAGGALVGINTQKMKEFFEGHLGVKIASARNMQRQKTKVGNTIKRIYEERKIENRIEHVKATRASC